MVPRLELSPFRFRDSVTGKWKRARYLAELHEIRERYREWEIIGPPEVREVDPRARYFTPHTQPVPRSVGNLGPALSIRIPSRPLPVVGTVAMTRFAVR
jgi:hypothetical protein